MAYRRSRRDPSRLGAFAWGWGVLIALLSGCAGPAHVCERGCISQQFQERIGHGLAPPSGCPILPPGVCLEDGLGEEEAVVIALWNNAAFQELLVDLELTRADLIQAKLLPNPELWYLNPVGVKQLEYALEFPIEALWLQPFRVKSARFENQRVCERLVQSGLDLMRDVRQGHADLLMAQSQLRVAEEGKRLRGRIGELAEARLHAGEASKLETATARIDALQAEQDLVRVRYDVTLAEERLRNLLGVPAYRGPLILMASLPNPPEALEVETLAALAVATRPDAASAAEAVLAAEERVRLARLSWFRFFGIVDANGQGLKGHEIGPGYRVTIPIFNWGQGGKARAEAELERAKRQRVTVHNQIILDVHRAWAQYQQANGELEFLNGQVRPEAEKAIRRAVKAYKEGDTSYLLVLESTRRLLEIHLRSAQLQANLRRAWAELERSVGRRLASSRDSSSTAESLPELPAPDTETEEEAP